MVVTVVGKTVVDFVDSKSCKSVRGTRVYGTHPIEHGFGEGLEVFTEYISANRIDPAQIIVGSKIVFDYTQKGKLVGVRLATLDDDLLQVE